MPPLTQIFCCARISWIGNLIEWAPCLASYSSQVLANTKAYLFVDPDAENAEWP